MPTEILLLYVFDGKLQGENFIILIKNDQSISCSWGRII